MIIGPDFVLITLPKAGATYCNSLLRRYNESLPWRSIKPFVVLRHLRKTPRLRRIIRASINWWIQVNNSYSPPPFSLPPRGKVKIKWGHPAHDGCASIPHEHSHKEILSILRTPHKQIVSAGWYKTAYNLPGTNYFCTPDAADAVRVNKKNREIFFSLKLFLTYCAETEVPQRAAAHYDMHGVHRLNPDLQLGLLSYRFIRAFCKNSKEILTMPKQELDDYFSSNHYRNDMYPVRFFRVETLTELLEYLRNKPYINQKLLNQITASRGFIDSNKNMLKPAGYDESCWNTETKRYFEATERIYIQAVADLAPLTPEKSTTS